ncbi:SUKH-4 family immunity protein [Muricauda oceani]|uniref:SMI1/KNR4 family protein n=1 Tax=Flagellimonas oceani TaxID=2698672 RepID=A0A6G7IZ94_9FLAO|nr:SUKH-4 family immunity protein [Allomuricauda oceani]MBW8244813.1 SUKH-4 family immunity protein [Allomuricauda oceani]QII43875.1 hypothetical protein GVT53_04020 [Allomuricauda oceani]
MIPENFKKAWTLVDDNLNPISLKYLSGLGLSQSSIDFFVKSGFPDSAAPFLSFSKESDNVYESVQRLTKVYDILEPNFNEYIVIGSCNDGDPIVINTKENDQIEFLDHENSFNPNLFNSNVYSMAKCLLAYRDFVISLQEKNGADAYFNSNFTDEQFERLKTDLTNADEVALKNNSFWSMQLITDLELRESCKNE